MESLKSLLVINQIQNAYKKELKICHLIWVQIKLFVEHLIQRYEDILYFKKSTEKGHKFNLKKRNWLYKVRQNLFLI